MLEHFHKGLQRFVRNVHGADNLFAVVLVEPGEIVDQRGRREVQNAVVEQHQERDARAEVVIAELVRQKVVQLQADFLEPPEVLLLKHLDLQLCGDPLAELRVGEELLDVAQEDRLVEDVLERQAGEELREVLLAENFVDMALGQGEDVQVLDVLVDVKAAREQHPQLRQLNRNSVEDRSAELVVKIAKKCDVDLVN